MTNPEYLILALFTAFALAATNFIAAALMYRMLVNCYGEIGFCVILAFVGTFVLPPVFWCSSLLPSLSHLHEPLVYGIGGGVYGLEYRSYAFAVSLFGVVAALGLMSAAVVAKLSPPVGLAGRSQIGRLISASAGIHRTYINEAITVLAVILFVAYYTLYGWDRVWLSERGRFEMVVAVRGLQFIDDVKFFLPLLLLVGTFAGISFMFSESVVWPSCSVLLTICPFITQASRGFTVIICVTAFAILRRCKATLFTSCLVGAGIVIYGLYIPLATRDVSETGLKVFFQEHVPALAGGSSTKDGFGTWAIALAQNVSLSFPIQVEVMTSQVLSVDTPAKYMLLSLSPTISAMDGFAANYLVFTPFINFYTPYSSFAELYNISAFALMLAPPVGLLIALWLLKGLCSAGNSGIAVSLSCALVFVGALVQAQQYPIRTAMRFVYLAYGIAIVGKLIFPGNPVVASVFRPSWKKVKRL